MTPLKSLASSDCKETTIARIVSIKPTSQRQWGKMTAHQMLCHLSDSFLGVIGERNISSARIPIPRPVLKWLVLRAPLQWSKNLPTRPEVEQGAGGTQPGEFERDRRTLLQALDRFCSVDDSKRGHHPVMGPLTREEWMRWGYLHVDHHLRQFGV